MNGKVALLLSAMFLTSLPIQAQPQDPSSQAEAAQAADQPPKKKLPTNGDVDNIGTRNINKHDIDFYSIEHEIQVGRQLSAQVERQVKLLNDPVIGEYVNRVGQNIVRNSDCKVPFTIKVVESDEINAFALPGGFFYVNTGLITVADNEAELAAVMGHETAHVCARHGMENQSKANLVNVATIPLIFLGGPVGLGIRQSAGLIIPLSFLSFSRANESEADFLGLQYMYKAGYDPSAFVSMFEKLQAKESARAGGVSPMFATHPATAERIAQTKKNIETILPDRDQYVVTTSEFDNIKIRLAMIENRKPNADDNYSGRPSLIKRTGTGSSKPNNTGASSGSRGGNNGSSGSTADDDRPILKRRDSGDSSSQAGTEGGSDTSPVPPPTETTPSDQPAPTSPDNSNTTQPSSDPNDDNPPVLIRKPGAGNSPPPGAYSSDHGIRS